MDNNEKPKKIIFVNFKEKKEDFSSVNLLERNKENKEMKENKEVKEILNKSNPAITNNPKSPKNEKENEHLKNNFLSLSEIDFTSLIIESTNINNNNKTPI